MTEHYKGFKENPNYSKGIAPAYFKTWETDLTNFTQETMTRQLDKSRNDRIMVSSFLGFIRPGKNFPLCKEKKNEKNLRTQIHPAHGKIKRGSYLY